MFRDQKWPTLYLGRFDYSCAIVSIYNLSISVSPLSSRDPVTPRVSECAYLHRDLQLPLSLLGFQLALAGTLRLELVSEIVHATSVHFTLFSRGQNLTAFCAREDFVTVDLE